MTMIAWVTDPHLNFVPEATVKTFASFLRDEADAILFTGDIAEADSLIKNLKLVEEGFGKPIYFVLGNHDYYRSSVELTKKAMRKLADESEHLVYLDGKAVPVGDGTVLVGCDSFYDARNGRITGRFRMTDWSVIQEFMGYHETQIPEIARGLADASVRQAKPVLEEACREHKKVIVATHFPPFPQSSWYMGERGDADALPWYTSKVMGDMLSDVAYENPEAHFTVLCGHTHSFGVYEHFDNLVVFTGRAMYHRQIVSGFIDTSKDPKKMVDTLL